jgi:secretion/DNA translocation related TadE-like protein
MPVDGISEADVPGERGLATVWTAFAVAALVVLMLFAFWFGAAAIARHRAEGAADLAALAVAGAVQRGAGAPCELASQVVERMASRLVGCRLDGLDALVEVTAAVPGVPPDFGSVGARARAGPVARSP